MGFDALTFKQALARFASGVTVVTTLDPDDRRRGFAASAFCSLSLDPPQILVCLDRNAECHRSFVDSTGFVVNILTSDQSAIALRFATKGVAKFDGLAFGRSGLGFPVLSDAHATLECRTAEVFPGGDHTILIGTVKVARLGPGEPAIYYQGGFHQLARGALV